MTQVRALLFGMIFGIGLILSGMTDPDKVKGFLDWTGAWNPALALVMGGAVLVALPFYAIASRRKRPITAAAFETPGTTAIDRKLIVGAALFGIGWGLTGICPGPGLVILGLGIWPIGLFLGAMMLGLWLSAKLG